MAIGSAVKIKPNPWVPYTVYKVCVASKFKIMIWCLFTAIGFPAYGSCR